MNALASLNQMEAPTPIPPVQILSLKEEFNRHHQKLQGQIPLPNGTVDLGRGEVCYQDGERSPISGREMALLQYLVKNAGRIISRKELLLQVWRMNPQYVITRTIDMHVAKLRDKLRDDPQSPSLLRTIRGRGYLFAPSSKNENNTSLAEVAESSLPQLAACY